MCSVVLDSVRVKIGLVNGKKLDKRGIKKATLLVASKVASMDFTYPGLV
jgi:hypothetical protein